MENATVALHKHQSWDEVKHAVRQYLDVVGPIEWLAHLSSHQDVRHMQ